MDGEQVLQLLSDFEKAVGDLYQECGRRFSDEREFWHGLADEEYRHAERVLSLKELLDNKVIRFTGRFNQVAINTALRYIKLQTAAVADGTLKPREAFSMAVSVETSLLESKGFDAFSGKSDEFHLVKDTLLRETAAHRNKIQAAMRAPREC